VVELKTRISQQHILLPNHWFVEQYVQLELLSRLPAVSVPHPNSSASRIAAATHCCSGRRTLCRFMMYSSFHLLLFGNSESQWGAQETPQTADAARFEAGEHWDGRDDKFTPGKELYRNPCSSTGSAPIAERAEEAERTASKRSLSDARLTAFPLMIKEGENNFR
jgi:hypothetical protein